MRRTTGGAVLSPHAPLDVSVKDKGKAVLSIEEELNAIRQYFGLSVSDTAQVLLVKRPTIYEWLAGTLPRPNNMKRIENVYEIAREWHALNPHPATRYLHHRVFNEKSLIKLLAEDPLDKSVIGETMRLISVQLGKDRRDRRSISDIAREHGFERPSNADQASALRRISAPISDAED
jgi:predicted transcriptional regulator